MGLFGLRSSISRLGTGAESTSAMESILEIVNALEAELGDDPGEYFVLQAAGMLFACEVGAVEGVQPVRTMQESLERAGQIMDSFVDEASTDVVTRESKAAAVYEQLRSLAAKGLLAPLLVGQLHSYLNHVEEAFLSRKAGGGRKWWQFWR